MSKKAKVRKMYVISDGHWVNIGYPWDQPCENNPPKLTTTIQVTRKQLKAWQEDEDTIEAGISNHLAIYELKRVK